MEHSSDAGTQAALKALIRHLVLSFPESGILSRQVGDYYHVFVMVPYGTGPEKTLQVERAWLIESGRSIKETERYLQALDLPGLFQTRERVELRYATPSQLMRVSRTPANEGWSGEPLSGTVCHGPLPLSGPSASRLPVQCLVHIQTEDGIGTGTLWNVSLRGCRISTPMSLSVGTRVALIILLPEPSGPTLVKTAQVRWTRGPEYGVHLVALHPVEAARIEGFVIHDRRLATDAQY